jgi:hypothetical protein
LFPICTEWKLSSHPKGGYDKKTQAGDIALIMDKLKIEKTALVTPSWPFLPQARPDQHWPSLLPGQTVSSPYSIIICLPHDGVATNNITSRRYVDHWSEAGFECAALMENTNSQRVSGGSSTPAHQWRTPYRIWHCRDCPRAAVLVGPQRAPWAADFHLRSGD